MSSIVERLRKGEFDASIINTGGSQRLSEINAALTTVCKGLTKEAAIKLFAAKIVAVIFDKKLTNNIRDEAVEIGFHFLQFGNATNLDAREQDSLFSAIEETYIKSIGDFRDNNYINWDRLWIFLIRLCHEKLHSKMSVANKLLRVVEHAFRNSTSIEQRLKAYDCWTELIDNWSINMHHMCSPKQIKLLMTPMKAKFSRLPVVIMKRCNTFVYLIEKLQEHTVLCLREFLEFCFGPFEQKNDGEKARQGRSVSEVCIKSTKALIKILGHAHPHELQCLNTDDICLLKPVINHGNFAKFSEVLINSCFECCVLLNEWNEDITNISTIFKCLWGSILGFMHKSNDNIKKKCTLQISTSLRKLEERQIDDKANVLGNLIDVLIRDKVSETMQEVLFETSLNLLTYEPDETSSYESETLQNFLEKCFDNENSSKYDKLVFNYIISISSHTTCPNASILGAVWLKSNFIINTANIPLMVWPIRYLNKFVDSNIIATKWSKLFAECKSDQLKLAIIQEMQSFTENPLLISGITTILCSVLLTETQPNIISKLLRVTELILTFPNITENDINKIGLIIGDYFKSNRNIFKVDNSDEAVDGLCRCLEHLVTIHKAYSILNDVYKNLMDASTKAIAKLYKGLSVFLEASILNDDNTAATSTRKLIELLESKNAPVENPTPLGSSRSLRIMNMASVTSKSIKQNNLKFTKEGKHSPIILRKPSPRISSRFFKKQNDNLVNDDKSSDYVKIDTEVTLDLDNLNDHQKEVLKKRREDIPALYSDLTQSQSQDLFSSTEDKKVQSKKRKLDDEDIVSGQKLAKINKVEENKESIEELETQTQENNELQDISTQSIEQESTGELQVYTEDTIKKEKTVDSSQNIEELTPTGAEIKMEVECGSSEEAVTNHISAEESQKQSSNASTASDLQQGDTETQEDRDCKSENVEIKFPNADDQEEKNKQTANNEVQDSIEETPDINQAVQDPDNDGTLDTNKETQDSDDDETPDINKETEYLDNETADTNKIETSSIEDKDLSGTLLSVNDVTDDSIGDFSLTGQKKKKKKKRKPRRSSEALLLVDAKHIEDSFNEAKKKLSMSPPAIEPVSQKKRNSRKTSVLVEVDTVTDAIESVIYKSVRLTEMKEKLIEKKAQQKLKIKENENTENSDQQPNMEDVTLPGKDNDVTAELPDNDNDESLIVPDTDLKLTETQSIKSQDGNISSSLTDENSVKKIDLPNEEPTGENVSEDSLSRASSRRAKKRISSFAEAFRKKPRNSSGKSTEGKKMVQKTIDQMLQDEPVAAQDENESTLQDDNQNKIGLDSTKNEGEDTVTNEIVKEDIRNVTKSEENRTDVADEKSEDEAMDVFVFKGDGSPKTAQKKKRKKSSVIFNRNDYTKRRKRAKKLARGLEEDGFHFHVTAEDTLPVVPLSESQDLRAVTSPQQNENITILITRSPSVKEGEKKTNSEEVIEETQVLPVKRGRGRPAKRSIVEEPPPIQVKIQQKSNLDLSIDSVVKKFSTPEISSPKSKSLPKTPSKSPSSLPPTPPLHEDEVGFSETKSVELDDHSYSLQMRKPVRRLSLTEISERASKPSGHRRRRTRTKSLEEEEEVTANQATVDQSNTTLDWNKLKNDRTETVASARNDDNLPSSPVTCDTPDRTTEFLNNTSDISPIHQMDDEEELVVRTPKTKTEKISNLRVARLLQMANSNIQIKTGGTQWFGTKAIPSPSANKLRKKKNKKHEELDVLTFSREVPSPLLAPASGILKRKFSALEESHPNVSLAKRKRVNFPEPAITAKKVFIKDSEEYPKENSFLFSEGDREDLLFDIKEFCTSKRQASSEEIKDWLEQLIRSLNISEVVDIVKEYLVKFETETITEINQALGEECSEELVSKYFIPNVEKEKVFDVFVQKLFVILKGLSNDKIQEFIRQMVKTFDEERVNEIVKEQLLEEQAEECVINKFDCDKMKHLIEKYVSNLTGDKRNEFLVDLIRMASDELPVEKKYISSRIGILQQYVERLND